MKDIGQGVIEGEEYLEYGIDVKDAIEIAEKLEKAALMCSTSATDAISHAALRITQFLRCLADASQINCGE
ncbi:MAG: hypothetical protein LBS53_03325 [Synergistaceae bacterium]|jgi:hypothetical protein|nr:hypothetical protein [Synergistaceae bacterium]